MPKIITRREILQRFRKVHGKKYLYHRIVYIHSKEKIEIYCQKCKEVFWQIPNKHISGSCCPKCSIQSKTKTYQQFEEKAKKIHSNFYAYHQDYKNSNGKVKIKCPKHGNFYQNYKD